MPSYLRLVSVSRALWYQSTRLCIISLLGGLTSSLRFIRRTSMSLSLKTPFRIMSMEQFSSTVLPGICTSFAVLSTLMRTIASALQFSSSSSLTLWRGGVPPSVRWHGYANQAVSRSLQGTPRFICLRATPFQVVSERVI